MLPRNLPSPSLPHLTFTTFSTSLSSLSAHSFAPSPSNFISFPGDLLQPSFLSFSPHIHPPSSISHLRSVFSVCCFSSASAPQGPRGVPSLSSQEVTESKKRVKESTRRRRRMVGGREGNGVLMVMTGTIKPNKTGWEARREIWGGRRQHVTLRWDRETSGDRLVELRGGGGWLKMESWMTLERSKGR